MMSDSFPRPIREEDLIVKANELLSCLHVPKYIRNVRDITADVFVNLFDAVYGEPLQDVIRKPSSHEDEVHNCQAVIDELAIGILNMSLYHITGEDVVRGKLEAVHDLLDVFDGLVEFLQDKISSVSTDLEDERKSELAEMDDPDLVTPEVIDDILSRELRKNNSEPQQESSSVEYSNPMQRNVHASSNDKTLNSTAELAALGNISRYSDLREDGYRTADLIALGQSHNESGISTHNSSVKEPLLSSKSASKNISDSSSDPSGRFVWTSDKSPSRPFDYNGKSRDNSNGKKNGKPTEHPDRNLPRLSSSRDKPNKSVTVTIPDSNSTGRSSTSSNGSGKRVPLTTHSERDSAHDRRNDGLHNTAPTGMYSRLPSEQRTDLGHTTPSDLRLFPDESKSAQERSIRSEMEYPELVPLTTDPELRNLGVRPQHQQQIDTIAPSTSKQQQNNTFTHHLYHHYNNTPIAVSTRDPLSQSLPAPTVMSTASDSVPHRQPSVIPAQTSVGPMGHSQKTLNTSATEQSLDSTQQSKSATDSSADQGHPNRYRDSQVQRLRSSNVDRELTESIRGALLELQERRSFNDPQIQGILSPSKKNGDRSRKNVSFLKPGSSTDTSRSSQFSSSELPRKVPLTYSEYKRKYHSGGRLRARSYSDEHINYCGTDSDSDHRSGLFMSEDADVSGLSAELEAFKQKIERKAKSVTFDDLLDDSAPGRMGTIRRKLKKEDQRGRMKKEVIHHLYEEELEDLEHRVEEHLARERTRAKETEKEYKQKVLKEPKSKKEKKGTKYNASVGVLVPQGRNRNRSRGRRRSASASPSLGYRAPVSIYDQEILPWLLEEFPFLHLSPETLQSLWRRSAHQVAQLSKAERDLRKHKSNAQKQVEDAERRQKVLTDIVKKELDHNQRLREVKDRQRAVQSVKSAIRDKRMQSANARRYYQEYQVRMRSKMLKKRSKEEQVFKKLFHDGLDIQKDRIRELRKYAKEQRNLRAKKQQDELESIENHYKDQFRMLAEAMARERDDMEIREKAQGKMVTSLKKEQRTRLEGEVKRLQEAIYRDEDDLYFRELDADRARTQLNLARYQARV